LIYYIETSEKLLLSSPPALPRGRRAFSGDPIIENYLKNGFPPGACWNDNPKRVSFSEVSI